MRVISQQRRSILKAPCKPCALRQLLQSLVGDMRHQVPNAFWRSRAATAMGIVNVGQNLTGAELAIILLRPSRDPLPKSTETLCLLMASVQQTLCTKWAADEDVICFKPTCCHGQHLGQQATLTMHGQASPDIVSLPFNVWWETMPKPVRLYFPPRSMISSNRQEVTCVFWKGF